MECVLWGIAQSPVPVLGAAAAGPLGAKGASVKAFS